MLMSTRWIWCKMMSFSGADLEGGAPSTRPLYFFAEIGPLTLCGRPRQKECTKSCKLTSKITIFLRFWAPPLLKNPGSAPDSLKGQWCRWHVFELHPDLWESHGCDTTLVCFDNMPSNPRAKSWIWMPCLCWRYRNTRWGYRAQLLTG